MPVTRADVTAILKEVYGDYPYDQMNNEVRLLSMIDDSDSFNWEGDVAVETLHVRRNHATKAVAESGLLPNAGKQGYLEMRVPQRYVYTAIEMTAQIMKTADSNRAAFTSVMDREVNGAVKDALVEINRMLWGDGRGVLALVNDDNTGGNTTFVVDSPMGIAGSTHGNRFIREGMVLAFHSAAPGNNTPLAVREVTAISDDGTEITVDASVSEVTAPNNGIITKGVTRSGVSEGSYLLEPMGILGLIDDGTFIDNIHNIVRSTTGKDFKANVLSGVGSLDEMVIHRLEDLCDIRGGGLPNKVFVHHSVHREYVELGLPDRRYTGDMAYRPDLGIRGGGAKSELMFGEQKIEKERMCPYGTMYGIDTTSLKRYPSVEGEWGDEDGSIFTRHADKDQFFAFYRRWVNYGVIRNNSSFVARDIDATIDVANAI